MSDTGKVISERMAKSRRDKGWTLRESAERMKVGLSRYSNWELGIRVPKYDDLVKAAEAFDVAPAWLAGFVDHPGNAVSGASDYVMASRPVISTQSGSIRLKNASDSTAFKADYLRRRDIPENKLLLIYADDDAMADVIQRGDELLIDQSRKTPETVDLFAFVVDGRAWVRWVRPELDGSVTVTAENADLYPPQHLTRDQLDGLDMLGRVARISRDR